MAASSSCAVSVVVPTTAAFRYLGCSPATPTGAVSDRDDAWVLRRICERRDTAKSRCAPRSPRFDPRAIATWTELLNPPRRQHFANQLADAVGPAPEQIGPARERLLEGSLLLDGLAENDPQHPAVAGVGHAFHLRLPAFHERRRVARIFLEQAVHSRGALARWLALGLRARRRHVAAEIDDGAADPGELRVFAVDDVLVGVVGVVLGHEPRRGLVPEHGSQLVAIELLEQRE